LRGGAHRRRRQRDDKDQASAGMASSRFGAIIPLMAFDPFDENTTRLE